LKILDWKRRRPRTDHACPQKPNPSHETVPLNCRLEEAEDVDVNAGIHGNWTMENAKSMLHQFIQIRHIKTDYKYAMQGTSFVAEMSFYVKVRNVVLDRGFS
jgi:hypothetical protein